MQLLRDVQIMVVGLVVGTNLVCNGAGSCVSSCTPWSHGNDGSQTCYTICAWGSSSCTGTSAYNCGTTGISLTCYCC